ncbi:MAG: hypothetical protein A2Y25_08775 [Candidatus Melainabacteria bacterium GWF2_37_15]|nr:MAG: hypothetical protein A2Y25_08775 [Candidatus Melainabacteria bacterium GWF2_37_15]
MSDILRKINSLLKEVEQEFLDFKQEHYKNNADFVLDVLCMANAEHIGDRYIIFGIENNTKKIIGVEKDDNRKNLQNYINSLRSSFFNNLPTIMLDTVELDKHQIDLLTIKNKKNRPYFLLKDKREGKKTVRAGVIYTRDGDNNTPIDNTAEPLKIYNMWREHFKLDLTPHERFKIYLQEHDKWLKQPTSLDKSKYYFEQFPEFTIERYTEEDCQDHEASCWYGYNFQKPAILYSVNLSYFNTVLCEYSFVSLDKERCFFPSFISSRSYVSELFPDKRRELAEARYFFEKEFYFTLKDNLSYELYKLFKSMYNYQTIEDFASDHWAKMPIKVFNNLEEVKLEIKKMGLGKIGILAK